MTEQELKGRILESLCPYQNTQHGANRYNTPWRDGADGGTLAVDEDPAYGGGLRWYDHKTEESGNGFTLADRLGIDRKGASYEPTGKPAYASLSDYARAHGVPVETLQQAGYQEVQRFGHLAFQFPTAGGNRYRYADEAKAGRKYDHERGYKACWYGLERAIQIIENSPQPLVICNGEISTVAAQYYSVAACCITGGEKPKLPKAHLEYLQEVYQGKIVIALDCDHKGRTTAPKLGEQLQSAGYDVAVLDLNGSHGFDIADFCRLNLHESATALQGLPQINSDVEYITDWQQHVISASALQRKTFEELVWVVDRILPEGACLLAGKPKSRKSWLALAISVAVATNGRVMGALGVTPGRVLFLDLESNQRRMQARLRSLMERGLWPGTLHIATEWPRGAAGLAQLDQWMASHPDTHLIVIDVMADFRRPKDPKEDAYIYDRETIKPINEWAERHRVTVLLIHHTRKAKADDVFDEISGSTGLPSAVATMWVIGRSMEKADEYIFAMRGRDLEDDEPLALKWDSYLCAHTILGDAAQYAVTAERREILDVLADGETWSPKDIAAELQKSVPSVKKLLPHLVSSGAVEKVGYGKYALVASYSGDAPHSGYTGDSGYSLGKDSESNRKSERVTGHGVGGYSSEEGFTPSESETTPRVTSVTTSLERIFIIEYEDDTFGIEVDGTALPERYQQRSEAEAKAEAIAEGL